MKTRLLTLLLLLNCAAPAWSAEREPEQVYAIQERKFARFHEIDLAVGFIPDDEFYYGYPVGLGYTFNFSETLAWEVLRAQWVFTQENDVRNDLESDFGATPERFDEMRYLVHTNFVFKPSYGKDALWNRSVVNHETFVLAGVGVLGYDEATSQGDQESKVALSLSFGLGRKFFLNETFCLNLEVRDYVNFKSNDVENNVYLGLSLGYRFNLSPRQAPAADEVEGLRRRLGGQRDE